MKGFVEFIREQGVTGLAVGFMLGGAVSKVVTALIVDIIDPIIGGLLGFASGLTYASFTVGNATIYYGDFISVMIDFVVIALVIYAGVKIMKLDKLKPKEAK